MLARCRVVCLPKNFRSIEEITGFNLDMSCLEIAVAVSGRWVCDAYSNANGAEEN